MSQVNVDCVLDIKASLGESPIWSVKDQILYWVDINNHLICKFDPINKINSIINVGDFIGCFALKKNLNIVLALTNGFFELEQKKGKISFLCNPKDNNPKNRFNDGTVDSRGRFYAGTMSLNPTSKGEEPKGSLYCLDPSGYIKKILDGFYTINGLAFSPDYKTAYVSDSAPWIRTIWSYDYNLEDGIWSNKKVFFETHQINGRPDGGCIDADGCYWMAGVSGWELVRITPKGKIDMIIKMPIEKPTKIAFGGAKLDTMYVTSIGSDITKGTHKKQPKAGGIFALSIPGIKGIDFPFYG